MHLLKFNYSQTFINRPFACVWLSSEAAACRAAWPALPCLRAVREYRNSEQVSTRRLLPMKLNIQRDTIALSTLGEFGIFIFLSIVACTHVLRFLKSYLNFRLP